jgi:signal transduction histidine kinase
MSKQSAPASSVSHSVSMRGRVRILIVDDNAVSRAYVAGVVALIEGIETTEVDSGADAMVEMSKGGISLILCDYEMPRVSGLQVLAFVRARYTALELPVLMLTSRDDKEIKVRAFRAGANDYISKQAPPEELQARVRTQVALLAEHAKWLEARRRAVEGQKFETVGNLAEALSHELNTPAQYIGDNFAFLAEGFDAIGKMIDALRLSHVGPDASELQALLEGVDFDYFRAEIPRCLEESRHGIAQVARIISVMREFGRVGSREPAAQDLNEIVRGALAVTRGQWHQVAELALELAENLPLVECVGAEIKQVLLYAIINAVKAMLPQDGLQRERGVLRLRTCQAPSGLICIEIADTGRRLEQHVLDQVQEPFLGYSTTDDIAHALAHARTVIVDEHGGTLELESVEGKGTRLTIHLPILHVRAKVAPVAAV